ncbi:MAG: DUF4140 domain-containing protein [Paracoccaceae bacterium]
MRPFLALLLATTALPALADTIPATSTITAVTVYPQGARITRQVSFTAPSAGAHELLVTDLPAATEAGLLQIAAPDGTGFGAFSLREDRLPPRDDALTPAQEAAQAEVDRLEAAEREAFAAVESVQARIDAANARAAFLTSFSGAMPDSATPDSLKATAAMIGAETLAARQEPPPRARTLAGAAGPDRGAGRPGQGPGGAGSPARARRRLYRAVHRHRQRPGRRDHADRHPLHL